MDLKTIALKTLTDIEDYLDQKGIDEVDFYDSELKAHTHKGVFLFNYHGVSHQIWFSSPLSGAHHYTFVNNQWISTRNDEPLWDRINIEFEHI